MVPDSTVVMHYAKSFVTRPSPLSSCKQPASSGKAVIGGRGEFFACLFSFVIIIIITSMYCNDSAADPGRTSSLVDANDTLTNAVSENIVPVELHAEL
jgi:hypothetical protein